MDLHFHPSGSANFAPQLLNEFKWLHFASFTSLPTGFQPLSPNILSLLLSSFHKYQGKRSRGMGQGGKKQFWSFLHPYSSLPIGNHVLSLHYLVPFTRYFHSNIVTLSCVCIHFTDDRIPGLKHTLEKLTRWGYRFTNSYSSLHDWKCKICSQIFWFSVCQLYHTSIRVTFSKCCIYRCNLIIPKMACSSLKWVLSF